MKAATSLFVSAVLMLAPVLAVSQKAEGLTEKELDAKCRAEGGCFVVSENGFKRAVVMAFAKGHALGAKECKGSI